MVPNLRRRLFHIYLTTIGPAPHHIPQVSHFYNVGKRKWEDISLYDHEKLRELCTWAEHEDLSRVERIFNKACESAPDDGRGWGGWVDCQLHEEGSTYRASFRALSRRVNYEYYD